MIGNEKMIKLSAEDVCEFVTVANLCEFPIHLSNDLCKVNAKCIEDVALLDFSRIYNVVYTGYDLVFERFLSRIATA